jgi:23S rRNA pseudouridine2605 synthase
VPHDRRLFTAGRLDRDSTGLLLLTTDGDWANRVMHPRYEKEKEYLVRFKGERPTPASKRIRHATFSEEGKEYGLDTVKLDGSYLRIVLHEGRKRHIRRVAEAAGLVVNELIRVRIGPVKLGTLKPGRWRKLTGKEIHELGKK